jgi:hypothetical protein
MEEGWIKLHRRLKDSEVFADPELLKLWILCLMEANHKGRWVAVSGLGRPVFIERGQFITGRYALHGMYYRKKKKTNACPSTVWRWLETLRDMKNLNIETNSRFSTVTITNYSTYQNEVCQNEQPNAQAMNSRCTAGEQPVRTTKNGKNARTARSTDRTDHLHSSFKETRVRERVEDVREFCNRKFTGGRNPVFDRGRLSDRDRDFLLKVGASVVLGDMPEGWVESALEAIRHHAGPEPIGNRGAFFTTTLSDIASKSGKRIGRMLSRVEIPDELRKPRSGDTPDSTAR